ncbi:hypothetical protein [Tateyamaria sp.]|uniref:hypothetical protein n=1 Tax=Tateyamaria sp. TaxID=1929288 RepID=UPI003B2253CD
MRLNQDTFTIVRDCENAVHETFKDHSDNPQALSKNLGALYTEFGQDAVMASMTNCMRIAYLRLRFSSTS